MILSERICTIVDFCGSESAQVVTASLPALLRRSARDICVRFAAGLPGIEKLDETTNGYVVLLSGGTSRIQFALEQLRQETFPAPILPIAVVNKVDDDFRTADAHRLRLVQIAQNDARIEHGGCFYLDPEIETTLSHRLKELTRLMRRNLIEQPIRPPATGCCLHQTHH